jgi:hypothetical protein
VNKHLTFSFRSVLAVGMICAILASCQSQETVPTLAPTQPVPTRTPIPPSPTSIPPTVIPPTPELSPTPVPSIQLQSLQDIVGDWQSPRTVCAGNPCLLQFKADGTFEIWDLYQGVLDHLIEKGEIAISDGIFHIETTGGECSGTTNGYYQVFLTIQEGKPNRLQFAPTQPDECADREKGLSFTYTFLSP